VTPPVLVLLGATATGKSALAVDVALALAESGQPAEIVNADSMLVYRGMDIGTAKPAPAERRGVPHHLIDTMDIAEPASVAVFQGAARAAIADCRARGVVPVVVGGSALYLHAIIDAVDFPPTDAAVRSRWAGELERLGPAALHAQLAGLDPVAAAGIDPGNGRRIVRALESVELTGRFAATLPEWSYALDGVTQIGLALDRTTMDARIVARVEAMWRAGFVAEVERLVAAGLRDTPTAARAIGYRQVMAYLDGQITEAEAKERTIIRTRQFARKQLAWWKRDPRIRWLPAGCDAAAVLAAAWRM